MQSKRPEQDSELPTDSAREEQDLPLIYPLPNETVFSEEKDYAKWTSQALQRISRLGNLQQYVKDSRTQAVAYIECKHIRDMAFYNYLRIRILKYEDSLPLDARTLHGTYIPYAALDYDAFLTLLTDMANLAMITYTILGGTQKDTPTWKYYTGLYEVLVRQFQFCMHEISRRFDVLHVVTDIATSKVEIQAD